MEESTAYPFMFSMNWTNWTNWTDFDNLPNGTDDDSGSGVTAERYILAGVLSFVVSLLGIAGNCFTTIVLLQPDMRSSTNVYLTGHTLCNLFHLAMVLIQSVRVFCGVWEEYVCVSELNRIYPFCFPIIVTCQLAAIWLTVAFSVDRYIYICKPFRKEELCSVQRSTFTTIGIVILCSLYCLPRWFDFTTVEHRETNQTFYHLAFTTLGENQLYRRITQYWMYVPFVCVIPFSCLAFFNGCLIKAVVETRRRKAALGARETSEVRITVMLIAVVGSFFVCQLPIALLNIAHAIDDGQLLFRNRNNFLRASSYGNFLVVLNGACSFALLCCFGQKFRETARDLCCQQRRKVERESVTIVNLTESFVQREEPEPLTVSPKRLEPREAIVRSCDFTNDDVRHPLVQPPGSDEKS